MKDKEITIKDIALKAEVSTGTVDRVLHKRGRVAPSVEKRVLKILKEMEYEPNIIARALSSKKEYKIAVLIPDDAYDNYWFAPKAGIKKSLKELKRFGLTVKFHFFDPYQVHSFVEKANEVNNELPDGIILSPIFHRETLPFVQNWKKAEVPFVLFNTEISDFEPLSYIGQDSYLSGFLAGKLINYGQCDPCTILIAHFDEETSNAAHLEKKEQGFRNYFTQNNLSQKYELIRADIETQNASLTVKQLDEVFETNPNIKAVFVTTSKAFEIAAYLNQKHIADVKIIGYDLLPKNIHYLKNNTINFLINQNPKGQGFWSLQLLADKLIFKKEVPLLKYLPLDIVTKENLNYFVGEEIEG
ncbi:LacI family DNA-binding transcriptional regulator [Pedobacter changchengzhani]|uniref:LacI family DNA-binding transcriptional regulator n=1 Tax=Pedobacter changchengzhani TaxID=2529274 RepID=A0A4R5MLK5_9SPHI|nr:substrate-binding domain-containing protein [Pedobacter changchengzhani]TDG36518.1 LacI family DNA-binding transcriptional regulator [Pedobacter changchengzhani]